MLKLENSLKQYNRNVAEKRKDRLAALVVILPLLLPNCSAVTSPQLMWGFIINKKPLFEGVAPPDTL